VYWLDDEQKEHSHNRQSELLEDRLAGGGAWRNGGMNPQI